MADRTPHPRPRRTGRRRARSVSLAVVLTCAAGLASAVSTAMTGSPFGGAADTAAAATVAPADPGPFDYSWLRTTTGQVAQSSPTSVATPSGPAIAVGTRDGHLHAFLTATGVSVPGWADLTTGAGRIDAALSTDGGNVLYAPLTNPPTNSPGVAAYALSTARRLWGSLPCLAGANCTRLAAVTVGSDLFTGGPTQYVRSLSHATGSVRWAYLNSDTTNSTPAYAAVTGGAPLVIFTDDQTGNARVLPPAQSGGHLRIFTTGGAPVCNANIGGGPVAPGSFDSSPAIGTFGSAPVIVAGTGQSGAYPNRVLAWDASCRGVWTSPALAGQTIAAPAIAAATGGANVVIEETAGPNGPVVYELDGRSGAVIRSRTLTGLTGGPCTDFVAGTSSSVATVTAPGANWQYVLAPAGACGVIALDGRSLTPVEQLARSCASQNSPLVSADGNGAVGVTIAGYRAKAGGGSEGCIFHYTLPGAGISTASWPQFHHDRRLTGAGPLGTRRNTLLTGQGLSGTAVLTSVNGAYTAGLLADGRLAVKHGAGVIWVGSHRAAGARLVVGPSDIRVVNSAGSTVWATVGRRESRPLHLTLRNDGRLALYVHDGNEWANDTLLWHT